MSTGVRGSVRIAETGRYMGRDVIEGGENHYIIDLPQIGLPSKYESSKGKAEWVGKQIMIPLG